jgi:hypothetical protein
MSGMGTSIFIGNTVYNLNAAGAGPGIFMGNYTNRRTVSP